MRNETAEESVKAGMMNETATWGQAIEMAVALKTGFGDLSPLEVQAWQEAGKRLAQACGNEVITPDDDMSKLTRVLVRRLYNMQGNILATLRMGGPTPCKKCSADTWVREDGKRTHIDERGQEVRGCKAASFVTGEGWADLPKSWVAS